ncbi:hypothetical protein HMPREF1147_2053 [Selenomonas sp. FOBRC9]|nr:hypothetical protein HMPREF1147_2053 [Selenomonas sp. FOBRC9]
MKRLVYAAGSVFIFHFTRSFDSIKKRRMIRSYGVLFSFV